MAFVGRERELSRLVGGLGGEARLVLVVGDAGVGKTRFAAEGMARAATAGRVMVRGDCLPLAGTLPLLPVTQALRELSALEGGRLLESALAAAPGYVRGEVGRLLPRLGPGEGPGPGERGEGWRERQFSAVAELLEAVAAGSGAGVGLVVEDVHWADTATLDCLTFLARTARRGAVTVAATCRGDEAPLAAPVADWLAHVRGAADVEEIQLGPLPRAEAAAQVAALAGGPVPPSVVGELYARAEGNPFFTEQLVAAALAAGPGGELRVPAGLPARLAGLLAARAGRCAGDAQMVLAALAVAARPLPEDLLGEVSGLDAAAVRSGLRELAAARLLAEDTAAGAHRARHALLAEAVAAGLLPGERAALHERTAQALAAAGGDTLAAEAAGHWQAARRPAEELPARIAAAGAAGRVFGYAQAAVHWRRAIELVQALPPDAAQIPDAELPRLYLRAIDAADKSGDMQQAGVLAEEAYRRFAGHPDPATAAAIHYRAGANRMGHEPEAGRLLLEESLRLFQLAPPSAEHAEALSWFGSFLVSSYGQWQDNHTLQLRAAEIAEAAAATAVLGRILADLAGYEFFAGDAEAWIATLQRARRAAEASGDSMAVLTVDGYESALMLISGDFARAEQVAVRGLDAARRAGLANWAQAANLAENAACAIWSQGRTADAAALVDPLTAGPPRADDWVLHVHRAFLDMLRGNLEAAAARQRQVTPLTASWGNDHACFAAELTAEIALWSGRPGDALAQVRQALVPYEDVPPLTTDFGRLLAAALRACADLTEQARARRDNPAARAAGSAARELAGVAEGMEQVPFTDHPHVAAIPAARATWVAEQARLAGASDPAAWAAAAKTWDSLGCPHRAGYAWWRQAQAQLDAGQPVTAATAALRAALAAADGHAPLSAQIRALAQRARIPLPAPPTARGDTPPAPGAPAPYGLTGRELAVLQLVAAGRTNAQIGAELYISPTTAGVHVSNILRKLGVTSRVQAAALAERAGLLNPGQP